MRYNANRLVSFLLVMMLSLSVGCAESAAIGKSITFVNSTGSMISEFYLAPESTASWGAPRNTKWLQAEDTVEVSFTYEELDAVTEWKIRVGVSVSGKVVYTTWNHLDLSPFLKTGFAGIVPGNQDRKFELQVNPKEFFCIFNETSFNIAYLYLYPSESLEEGDNRLEQVFLPQEFRKVRLTNEEATQETLWNLVIGAENESGVTRFTLKNFNLDKLIDCECVILKPYKDSISFYYSSTPVQ